MVVLAKVIIFSLYSIIFFIIKYFFIIIGPCIALRADMDGLPVQETISEHDPTPAAGFISKNKGVMHACGHDGHMAGLLGAARVLFNERATLNGSIKLLFQPAEEGYAGAKKMLEEGCLGPDEEDGGLPEQKKYLGPKVNEVYGIHLWSFNETGNICVQSGPVMAASDRFKIKVHGRGGHGAAPQFANDAIITTCTLVSTLNQIISRNIDPLDEEAVITCGSINGGYGYNIIADEVNVLGTCRSFTPQVQGKIKKRMREVCCGIGAAYDTTIDFDYEHGYPPTVNAYPECNKLVTDIASQLVGEKRSGLPQKTMGAEDFSYFLEKKPGCFFFIGAGLPGIIRPHHKSVFDFDEKALLISASMFVLIARSKLA